MERTTLQVGTFEVNCTILAEDGKAWIVDPGSEADRILAALKEKRLAPAGILLTHAHFDHIGGIPGLQAAFPDLPVYVHPDDVPAFAHPMNQFPPDYPAIGRPKNLRSEEVKVKSEKLRNDLSLKEEENPQLITLHSSLFTVTIIPTPGHTPGGVCYYLPDDKLLLAGDTLFAGSVGRTDLPGGDMATLRRSLEKLKALPPDTTVIPGHGMFTTIGDELDGNPFLR